MKTKLACLAVAAFVAITFAGCASQPPPKTVWLRTDGRVTANDPVLNRQFEVDRTVCSGDTGKAGLTALNPVTPNKGYYNGVVGVERGALSSDVMKGCMAEKGYVLVYEDEVPAKAAQFAAASAQQAKQEAAAKQVPNGKRVANAQ